MVSAIVVTVVCIESFHVLSSSMGVTLIEFPKRLAHANLKDLLLAF